MLTMARRPSLSRSLGSYYTQNVSIPAPFRLKVFDVDRQPSFMNEKILLEAEIRSSMWTNQPFNLKPDVGEQRKTTFKALPKPPLTPKRALQKFRITVVLVGILGAMGFMLISLALLAGMQPGYLEDVYIIKVIRKSTLPTEEFADSQLAECNQNWQEQNSLRHSGFDIIQCVQSSCVLIVKFTGPTELFPGDKTTQLQQTWRSFKSIDEFLEVCHVGPFRQP
jgi:hypothetical protein